MNIFNYQALTLLIFLTGQQQLDQVENTNKQNLLVVQRSATPSVSQSTLPSSTMLTQEQIIALIQRDNPNLLQNYNVQKPKKDPLNPRVLEIANNDTERFVVFRNTQKVVNKPAKPIETKRKVISIKNLNQQSRNQIQALLNSLVDGQLVSNTNNVPTTTPTLNTISILNINAEKTAQQTLPTNSNLNQNILTPTTSVRYIRTPVSNPVLPTQFNPIVSTNAVKNDTGNTNLQVKTNRLLTQDEILAYFQRTMNQNNLLGNTNLWLQNNLLSNNLSQINNILSRTDVDPTNIVVGANGQIFKLQKENPNQVLEEVEKDTQDDIEEFPGLTGSDVVSQELMNQFKFEDSEESESKEENNEDINTDKKSSSTTSTNITTNFLNSDFVAQNASQSLENLQNNLNQLLQALNPNLLNSA